MYSSMVRHCAYDGGGGENQPSDTAVYYMAWKFHHYMQ